jgi:hypothetical protein
MLKLGISELAIMVAAILIGVIAYQLYHLLVTRD